MLLLLGSALVLICGHYFPVGVLSLKVVRNPMVEKPNKDGKPPTIEYQEEEILVCVLFVLFIYLFWLITLILGRPLTWSLHFLMYKMPLVPRLITASKSVFFFPLHSRTLFIVRYCSSATACIR